MHFEKIIASLLEEKEDKTLEYELLPWCIEITKNPSKSEEYNELGRLIIKLNEIRARMK